MSDPAGAGHPDIVEAIGDETMHRHSAWAHGEKELVERQVAALEQIAKVLKKSYQSEYPDEPIDETEAQPKAK